MGRFELSAKHCAFGIPMLVTGGILEKWPERYMMLSDVVFLISCPPWLISGVKIIPRIVGAYRFYQCHFWGFRAVGLFSLRHHVYYPIGRFLYSLKKNARNNPHYGLCNFLLNRNLIHWVAMGSAPVEIRP